MTLDVFEWAFRLVIGLEGGYTRDSKDPGNWTSGRIAQGELRGTKYGISAASYPTLDIASLTLDQAKGIYKRDYWDAMRCGQMTRRLSVLVFDSAVQHGQGKAREWLAVPLEFETYLGRRIAYYASLDSFQTFGEGWMNRVSNLLLHLSDQPDSVDTVVFNGLTSFQLVRAALRGRLDGGLLYRERPTADGTGGKIDIRPA